MALPYPQPSSEAVSRIMRGNRRRDTRPELQVRRLLHREGLRYRVDQRLDIGGCKVRPDIVFAKRRVAVFIDGCFWHGCPEHGRVPTGANASYWELKLGRNRRRDAIQDEALKSAGWTVIRMWEHVPAEDAATRILTALGRSPERDTDAR
jgi:DNA mismatch endonuclease (patch repair protein)